MESQTCIDCKTKSPETDTNYTLISAQHGWRLHRTRAADGSFVMGWRCPSCWQRFKRATGAASSPDLSAEALPPSPPSVSPRAFFARAARRLRGNDSEPPSNR